MPPTFPFIGPRYRNLVQRQIMERPKPLPTSEYNRKSFTLNGSDEYFLLGNVLDQEKTDPFSGSCWIKASPGLAAYQVIFRKSALSGYWEGYLFAMNNNDRLFLRIEGDGTNNNKIELYSNSVVANSTWMHVGYSYNGSETAAGSILYINGQPAARTVSRDTLSGSISNPYDFSIGASYDGGAPFRGQMDELVHWSKALSAAEMSQVYRSRDLRALPFSQYIQGYWSGDGSNGSRLVDYSGNGYHGTPQNMDASNFTTDVHTPT